MNRTKDKAPKAEKLVETNGKAEKPLKPEKVKKALATNGAIDHRLAESFPMIKLIDQRIAESVPKEIIDKVNAVTSKRQIICSTYPYDKCIKNKAYEKEAKYLQIELVKMQAWVQKTGAESGDGFSRVATRRARAGRSSALRNF